MFFNKIFKICYSASCAEITLLFFDFFKEVGAYAAKGALVIFGQLIALVNVVANGANKLLHADFPPSF